MLLENKAALIYGAGGAIGGAVAQAFAREGARVFLSGRSQANVEQVADAIRAQGGVAETAVVDACDEQAVDAYVDRVAKQAGSIDISFNVITYGDVQKPLMELSLADFLQPITIAMQTQFLTTRAAVRHIRKDSGGVILYFGGGGPQTLPGLGGFKIALDAIEGLRRQWAVELGAQGIRVVTLKTGGVPESIADSFPEKQTIADSIAQQTLLGRAATLADVGNMAAFIASDHARTITATEINISAGGIIE